MIHEDILLVEYCNQLTPAQRAEYRKDDTWQDYCHNVDAVQKEFDRIDAGRKALCLS